MKYVEQADPRPEPISIARCRELFGKEAESMTDQDVEDIRRHAETMACKGRVHFVVVFNLTRFARDKYDHFAHAAQLDELDVEGILAFAERVLPRAADL